MGLENQNFADGRRREPPRFDLLPLSALCLNTSCDYLIKGLMPATGLQVLYGPPGVGKSFLALDASLHVAAGRAWAGRKVRQGGVIYVASEGARGFRKRVLASVRSKGFAPDIPFALIETAPELGRGGQLEFLMEAIEEQCAGLGIEPRLIVLDTLARSIPNMNESDTRDMNSFIDDAADLSMTFGALVMPVHHTGKDMDRGMRGSSALNGAADAIWFLKKEGAALSFGLEKMKDGEGGFEVPFTLASFTLGTDEDGDPIETLVAEVSGETRRSAVAPKEAGTTVGCTMAKIEATLRSTAKPQRKGAEARAAGLPEATPALSYMHLRRVVMEELRREDPGQHAKTPKTTFDRGIKALIKVGRAVHRDDWVWLVAAVTPEDDVAEDAAEQAA